MSEIVVNDQIYWTCADVLVLAVQLPAATTLPPVPELQQRLMAALDGIVSKGRSAGVPDVELAEARYALTAFIDALRGILLQGASLAQFPREIATLVFWLIVPFALALKIFRWR